MLKTPTRVLHMHFMPLWSYYDIGDSFRKLLLTSLVLFVADPSSPSRPLFLLSVDAVALVVLAASRPYKFRGDDLLNFALVLVEVAIFMVALLLLSGAAAEAHYSVDGMLRAVFVLIVSVFAAFVPLTWLIKLRTMHESIKKYTGARLSKFTMSSEADGGGDGTEMTSTRLHAGSGSIASSPLHPPHSSL